MFLVYRRSFAVSSFWKCVKTTSSSPEDYTAVIVLYARRSLQLMNFKTWCRCDELPQMKTKQGHSSTWNTMWNIIHYSYTICLLRIVEIMPVSQQHTMTQRTDERKENTAENIQMPSKSAKQSLDHSHLAIRYPHRLRLEFPVDGLVQNAYSPAELTLDTKRTDRGKIKTCTIIMPSGHVWKKKVSTVDIFFPILLPIARESQGEKERDGKERAREQAEPHTEITMGGKNHTRTQENTLERVLWKTSGVRAGNGRRKIRFCSGQRRVQFSVISESVSEVVEGNLPRPGLIGRRVAEAGERRGEAARRTRGALRQGKGG